jgi:5-methylcytosine-specific restriction protein B
MIETVREDLLKLHRKITELHKKMTAEAKLASAAQLTGYYGVFRQRFGPAQLASLDGEALLEAMHNHSNPDSLVYWLEFKNDEEFPDHFGSIAGGSALKFGIYRRKETGAWTTGSAARMRELSLEEAVAVSRKHRDQFVAGAALLEGLPRNASDEEYLALQREIAARCPDIENTAWGHKYFSLLYPEKLDFFHVADYQRFHLIKLLQEPPEGEGRYLAAGRFVRLAAELGMHVNHLCRVLGELNGRPYRYWRVGTSDETKPRNRWDLMRDGSLVAIGWPELGDLSGFILHGKSAEQRERLRALMAGKYPSTPQAVGNQTAQVWNFLFGMAEGDLVLPCDGATVLGIGKVTSSYFYEPDSDFFHRRRVQWLSLDEWQMPVHEGLRSTFREFHKYAVNRVEVERRLLEVKRRERDNRGKGPDKGTREIVVPALDGIPGRIQKVLERKGQVVLYGPPGTGKTYWAETAAHQLAAGHAFGRGFERLTEEERLQVTGTGEQPGLVRMCCFHPAYGYEDFLEGYRPETSKGQMTFVLRPGIFKALCGQAQANSRYRYYLIVDEINRGDIPRIFGELLTVLEKSKRDKHIILPLSGELFRVPENLFIIGTMNTADRSIALMDAALRRRFGFVELMPDPAVLGDAVVDGIPLGPWLEALNQRICRYIGRDARNLQVGHTYLMDGPRPIIDFERLSRALREDLLPLLEEYCYEDYATLERIMGRAMVDVVNQRIRDELFEVDQKDKLVQALLATCPEVAASSPAVQAEQEQSAEDEPLEDGDEDDPETGDGQ